jgi:pimeloyl-ACP methyl ester carboxylesterase
VTEFSRVALRTGVTLNVATAGNPANPAAVLLHGFPESHRTWRELAPRLAERFFLVMPDQRGFAGSDRPKEVHAYRTNLLVEDVFSLVDALNLEDFAIVGHDWGGAIAWNAALRNDPRLKALAIINAPHPIIFQKSLIENGKQRAASQYIRALRAPMFEKFVEAKGFDWFFEQIFSPHVDLSTIAPEERAEYIAEWSQPGALRAMVNWYRAARLIVPPRGLTISVPEALVRAFAKVKVPTLVVWGMKDKALLPAQLDGLDALVEELEIARLPKAGHFAPWEAPEDVLRALEPFLAATAKASAAAT